MTDYPKFKVAFDMESEYELQGKLYCCRVGAFRTNSSSDYFATRVKLIGTVTFKSSEHFHDFPSEEVCSQFSDLFQVPLVAARYTQDYDVQYNGPAPEVVSQQDGVLLKAYADLLRWKEA